MATKLRISFTPLVLVMICMFAVQVSTNILIETGQMAGRLSDRIPFYASIMIGVILAKTGQFRLFRWKVLILSLLFFVYLTGLVILTADDPWVSYVAPNYGIVAWTLMGITCNLAIGVIERRIYRMSGNRSWYLFLFIPTLMLGYVIFTLRDYAREPWKIESYQFTAANIIVLLLFGLLALSRWQAAIKGKQGLIKSMIPTLIFILLGTFITYLGSTMNSVAIVVVWIFLCLAVFWRFILINGWRKGILLAAPILIAISIQKSEMIREVMTETRFSQLREGSLMELSSVTSRMQLLPLFSKQFGVSPIFGDMGAEVSAGFSRGEYVHSLPLSALTHTGLIGSILLFSLIFVAVDPRRKTNNDKFAVFLFGVVLLCATASAFFTWIPLWFMIGYLTVNTSLLKQTLEKASDNHC